MDKQFKIWPVLRDVIVVTVLTGLGGFIVGFASTDHSSRFYFYGIALSNSLFCIIGFTISGCLAVGNRWRHLAFVAAIVWAASIFNVIFFGVTIIQWTASAIAVAIFTLIGGGISLLFKRKNLEEISPNAGDDKFYDEVAHELQEKPMVPGLWTKAFAEMGGDDAKARALYIKYRVAQLMAANSQRLKEERLGKQQFEEHQRVEIKADERKKVRTESMLAAQKQAQQKSEYGQRILVRFNKVLLLAVLALPIPAGVFGYFGGLHSFYGEGRKGVIFQDGLDAGFGLFIVTAVFLLIVWLIFIAISALCRKCFIGRP